MEYWHRKLDNKLERLEKEQLEKHPELLGFLESKGYIRVNSEKNFFLKTNETIFIPVRSIHRIENPYKKPVKKASIKKAVKKVAKKVTKKKK